VPGDPPWGAPRIHGELLKLDIDISQTSVSKSMVWCRKPPFREQVRDIGIEEVLVLAKDRIPIPQT
jgi:hypothetical protein